MLRRRIPRRQRSPKRVPTSPEDQARLDWLHTLPCCAPGVPSGCGGPPIAHHDTQDRARSRKAGQDRAMPMCEHHHVDFHGLAGPFKGWVRDQLRAWQTGMVARYKALWEQRIRATHHENIPF